MPMAVTAADTIKRTITGTIVSWDEQGNTSVGPTVFAKDSIEIKPVKLLLEHDRTRPIGKMVSHNVTVGGNLSVTGTSTLTGTLTATAGLSGPLTSSSATITGGTINGAVIGGSSAQAITGTTVTASTGFVGGGK